MIHQLASTTIPAVATTPISARRPPEGQPESRRIQATSSAPSTAIQPNWRLFAQASTTQSAANPAHAPPSISSR
jgi:hypothetical protein